MPESSVVTLLLGALATMGSVVAYMFKTYNEGKTQQIVAKDAEVARITEAARLEIARITTDAAEEIAWLRGQVEPLMEIVRSAVATAEKVADAKAAEKT